MPSASAPMHTMPMAGGRVLDDAIADKAAEWLTLLMSGDATREDQLRLQAWRAADPDHERAWQHIETVIARLTGLQGGAAYRSLSTSGSTGRKASPGRRKTLNALLCLGAAGVTGVLVSRTRSWQHTVADFRSGVGEQREVTLEDGTRIQLNTATAIDVRFDAERRLIRMVTGEMLVTSGHLGEDRRPLVIETAEGRVRALGTRFSVRQRAERTEVAVLESAVEITPFNEPARPRVISAGQSASFSRTAVDAPGAVDELALAWTRSQLIADDMRLDDFLSELGRYRRGLIRCDPAVAALRFSGVFPLGDTDRILAMLPAVMPVQVRLRTRFWVTVEAAQ